MYTISLPPVFCAYSSSHNDTVTVINRIDTLPDFGVNAFRLDMSVTTQITAAACLMLFASITQYKTSAPPGKRSVEIVLPTDKVCRRLVRESKLYFYLKKDSSNALLKMSGRSFSCAKDLQAHVIYTQKLLRERSAYSSSIDRALQEAILNVINHAYPEGNQNRIRVWQYLARHPEGLVLLICDKGCGIPESFRKVNTLENRYDGVLIEYAMRPHISSSLESGRGNGSTTLKRAIELSTKGLLKLDSTGQQPASQHINSDQPTQLWIRSGKGLYIYDGVSPPKSYECQTNFMGTVIEMSIIL